MIPNTSRSSISGCTIRQLVELNWHLADADGDSLRLAEVLADNVQLELWSASKGLAQSWLRRLNRETPKTTPDDYYEFESLACEILTAEMVLRTFATVLTCAAVEQDLPNPRPILDHMVQHVVHARSLVLAQLVDMGEPAAPIDRWRRRCERWTDLLISTWLLRYGVGAYAHDGRRAWDYGEEHANSSARGLGQQLLQHSYSTAFQDRMSAVRLTDDAWQPLLQQIHFVVNTEWMPEAVPEVDPAMDALESNQPSKRSETSAGQQLLARCLRALRDRPEGQQGTAGGTP